MKKILYITYDGITDPLGQSQILPYLKGLAKYGYSFTILSFEKKNKLKKYKNLIQEQVDRSNIKWVYLHFSKNPPLFAKLYDVLRMKQKAFSLYKDSKFDMVHCRGYISADVGFQLKESFGVKVLFDMRGFWADEKKDGSWNVRNPIFNLIYKYYKKKEKYYLQNADYIISLTEAGKNEIMSWSFYNSDIPIKVIPTCVDMDLFSLTDETQKINSRKKLGISSEIFVLSYLGSLGTWYMLDEMLIFFLQLKKKYLNSVFLFVTNAERSVIEDRIKHFRLNPKDFIITEVTRDEVPFTIKASDINISFIKPVYSKISSSPTKLGEVLVMGIPVICNKGVGDVETIVKKSESGYVIENFSEKDFEKAINSIPELQRKQPIDIRNKVKDIFNLENGVRSYLDCYKETLS